MYTRDDFERIIADNIDTYPDAATLYRAGDPRIMQHLGAVAEMASMLSQQIDLEANEAFLKARDTTVLADAALKNILLTARPMRVSIRVVNSSDAQYDFTPGQRLLDSTGRIYEVSAPKSIAGGDTDTIEAKQVSTRTVTHAVSSSAPFYRIEIPGAGDGSSISSLSVSDLNGNVYAYSERFTNVDASERVFHIEVDECRRLFVMFGYDGVVGYQPRNGDTIRLTMLDTFGEVAIKLGSSFAFEYVNTAQEAKLKMTLAAILEAGAQPNTISVLRDLTQYPAVYDHDAVFLGEFDFLLRRQIPSLTFLSVWNEQVEESVRGPDVDNINRLFVSFSAPGDAAAMQQTIRDVVAYADDSYRVTFIQADVSPVSIAVTGSVARVYNPSAVESQIKTLLLANYGLGSVYSKRGGDAPKRRDVSDLLKKTIVALQDSGSDFSVSIGIETPQLPEHWHYVTEGSMTIDVQLATYNASLWGV